MVVNISFMRPIEEIRNKIGFGGYEYPNVGGFQYGFRAPIDDEDSHRRFFEIKDWCNGQFGVDNIECWFANKNIFWFSGETDASVFKMRWL